MSTHLCVRSAYSLLNGTMSIQKLVKKAKKLGYQSIALSDVNSMHGVMEFVFACKKEDIKPIVGLEIRVKFLDYEFPILCLAKNDKGYKSLLKISSIINTGHNVIDLSNIENYQDDLFVLIFSDESLFDQTLLNGSDKELEIILEKLLKLLPNFILGISKQEDQFIKKQNNRLKNILSKYDVKSSACHRVYYAEAEEDENLRVLRAIDKQLVLSDRNLVKESFRYMLSKEEMESLYNKSDCEMSDYISNNCDLKWESAKTFLPKFETPNQVLSSQYLTQLCLAGLEKRLDKEVNINTYRTRLKNELDVIVSMQYEDYFLIVWDFIRFAKTQGIYVGPGRGSAAGSLVSYCLGITHVDPIEHDLLFERFLNPERISLPDIDTDFPDNRRDEVIQYVLNKYGKDHVAHISTFGTLAAKQVLRDVGRVMEINIRDLDSISKTIPSTPKITLAQAYEQSNRFKQLIASDERFQKLFKIASSLEGLPRHISTHAAGIVMSSVNLTEVVPLIQIESDMLSTQFTMEYLESLGLIKMDFLGLRNLTIIDDVVQAILKEKNKSLNILKIPLNDAKTLALVKAVDTVGIFQLESEGMKNLLRQMKTSRFDDIVATIALFRPGPMENIPEYIHAKEHPEQIRYIVPELKPIVESTYGILIYQEQIMQVAQKMAGFSLAKADLLRKAMSKKNANELTKLEQAFIQGCIKNNYSENIAKEVYALIFKFANYGFNKSHSVAYAMISYQMAYLKANYPDLFFVALLNSVIGSESKTFEYLQEAKNHKVNILGPSVNSSKDKYFLENSSIRFPLQIIKGVGTVLSREILNEQSKGIFLDYYDFIVRMSTHRISKSNFESLIDAGALDEFLLTRNTMKASLQDAIDYADMIKIEKNQQISIDTTLVKPLDLVILQDLPLDRVENERAVLGFYLSDHPLIHIKKKYNNISSIILMNVSNSPQSFIAMIKKVKQHRTKNGSMMAFLSVYDESGEIDCVVMPNVYQLVAEQLKNGALIKIEGIIEKEKSCFVKKIDMIER
jgi:DNA polymerase III subunit alpha